MTNSFNTAWRSVQKLLMSSKRAAAEKRLSDIFEAYLWYSWLVLCRLLLHRNTLPGSKSQLYCEIVALSCKLSLTQNGSSLQQMDFFHSIVGAWSQIVSLSKVTQTVEEISLCLCGTLLSFWSDVKWMTVECYLLHELRTDGEGLFPYFE